MRFRMSVAALLLVTITGQSWSQEIPYNRKVNLLVGESQVVYGVRARDCGGTPPTWNDLKFRIPDILIGTFSDAGIGTRQSQRCGGIVPARAIRFTATKKGRKRIKMQGDPISIVVK